MTSCQESASQDVGVREETRRSRLLSLPRVLFAAMTALALACFWLPALDAGAVSGTDTIRTLAGTGVPGNTGDNGPALSAQIDVIGVAFDGSGNIYMTDANHGVVRKITPSGTISTWAGVAGATSSTPVGDGGQASAAALLGPQAITFDSGGNAYIVETQGHRVRKVTPAGVISTVAGTGTLGRTGDGGPATAALLSFPRDVAVDTNGDLYIADGNNAVVRKVTAATGVISTFAGNGTGGHSGDGGQATAAQMRLPAGVLLSGGNLYITDAGSLDATTTGFSGAVRKVVLSSGVISTVAGNPTTGSTTTPPPASDGQQATTVQLMQPQRLAMDSQGNLYISDNLAHRIRKVDTGGVITTVAGTGTLGSSGDGGPANAALIANPMGLALRADGSLVFAEYGSGRIREVQNPATPGGSAQYRAIAAQKQNGQPVGCVDVNYAAQQALIVPVEVRWLGEIGVKCPDATVSTEGVPSEQYVVMLALATHGQLNCADIEWNASYGYLTWSASINLLGALPTCTMTQYSKMVTLLVSKRLNCGDVDWNYRNGFITSNQYGWLGSPLGCPPLA